MICKDCLQCEANPDTGLCNFCESAERETLRMQQTNNPFQWPVWFLNVVWFPVWFLTCALRPFLPQDHKWKHQRFTLESWHKYGTPIALEFSVAIWLSSLALLAMVIYVAGK